MVLLLVVSSVFLLIRTREAQAERGSGEEYKEQTALQPWWLQGCLSAGAGREQLSAVERDLTSGPPQELRYIHVPQDYSHFPLTETSGRFVAVVVYTRTVRV